MLLFAIQRAVPALSSCFGGLLLGTACANEHKTKKNILYKYLTENYLKNALTLKTSTIKF